MRSFRFVVVALVTLGIILRLWHWGFSRSLWIDEARLALNVAGRSFGALAQPLWFDQSAPLLFLWSAKLATLMFGVSEESLRLIPTFAALAAVPLMYGMVRLVMGERGALYASALLAVSPIVLYFSNEAKPYSSDVLVSTVLFLVTFRALSDATDRTLHWIAAAGLVAPWVSLGAYFVLPGCYLALWLARATRARAWQLGAIGAMWILSCFVAYSITYAPAASNPYLYEFWQHRLLVPGPGFLTRVWEAACEILSGSVSGIVALPGTPGLLVSAATILTGILMIIGSWAIAKRSGPHAIIILLPLVLLAMASLIGRYPLALRLAFFALPSLYVLFSAGAIRILGELEKSTRFNFSSALLVVLLVVPTGRSLAYAVQPERWGPIADAVEDLRRQAKPDDVIYIGAGALPAWAFYSTDWDAHRPSSLQAFADAGSSGGYAFENRSPASLSGTMQGVAPMGGRREIWGRPTGMQWRWGTGFVRDVPIDGWADAEAWRIRANVTRFAWVFMTHAFGAEQHLDAAIRNCGGDLVQSEYGGALRKYAFAPESTRVKCQRHAGTHSTRPANNFIGENL
jgi:hypothetical protein